jgi:hypothetical protein
MKLSFSSEIYAYTDIRNQSGTIQRLLSGESGKCWSPPVRAQIATARIEENTIVLKYSFSQVFCSMRVHTIKNPIPTREVIICLSPEKNP